MRARLAIMLSLALLIGCDDSAKVARKPPPQEISETSTAEFCGMGLTEHGGPKGQVYVRDRSEPYFFASVRDLFAFTMLPEMPKAVVAMYVNDMARATDWDRPQPGTWADAGTAWYVIASRRRSGMDADEAIPFGTRAAAEAFAQGNGGRIVRFAEMPTSYIFPDAADGS